MKECDERNRMHKGAITTPASEDVARDSGCDDGAKGVLGILHIV